MIHSNLCVQDFVNFDNDDLKDNKQGNTIISSWKYPKRLLDQLLCIIVHMIQICKWSWSLYTNIYTHTLVYKRIKIDIKLGNHWRKFLMLSLYWRYRADFFFNRFPWPRWNLFMWGGGGRKFFSMGEFSWKGVGTLPPK